MTKIQMLSNYPRMSQLFYIRIYSYSPNPGSLCEVNLVRYHFRLPRTTITTTTIIDHTITTSTTKPTTTTATTATITCLTTNTNTFICSSSSSSSSNTTNVRTSIPVTAYFILRTTTATFTITSTIAYSITTILFKWLFWKYIDIHHLLTIISESHDIIEINIKI